MAQLLSDPDALATLISGILTAVVGLGAIGGAVVVGIKQAGITARQADIADRQTAILQAQVEVEQKRIAHELYERRYKAFDTSVAVILAVLQGNLDELPEKARNDFLVAMQESRFLFPSTVYDELDDIWKKAVAATSLNRKMRMDHARTGAYGPDDPQKQYDLGVWADQRLRTLHEVFPQLDLG